MGGVGGQGILGFLEIHAFSWESKAFLKVKAFAERENLPWVKGFVSPLGENESWKQFERIFRKMFYLLFL